MVTSQTTMQTNLVLVAAETKEIISQPHSTIFNGGLIIFLCYNLNWGKNMNSNQQKDEIKLISFMKVLNYFHENTTFSACS